VVHASVAFGWFVEVPASTQAVRLLDAAPSPGSSSRASPNWRQGCSRSWCQRLDHPADDCRYLALAESRNARLIRQDQRLLRRLGRDPQAAGLAVTLEAC
jgi:hypothetical protein